jgi:hypothetical protein
MRDPSSTWTMTTLPGVPVNRTHGFVFCYRCDNQWLLIWIARKLGRAASQVHEQIQHHLLFFTNKPKSEKKTIVRLYQPILPRRFLSPSMYEIVIFGDSFNKDYVSIIYVRLHRWTQNLAARHVAISICRRVVVWHGRSIAFGLRSSGLRPVPLNN